MTTRIIWDFNGTIINDLPLSREAINKVLAKRSLPVIATDDDYRSKFGFPIKDYYATLGFDFKNEPYKIPADEWVALYNDGIRSIPLTDGIAETLGMISELGIPQMILSASERKMLISQINFYGIGNYFDSILGCDDVYGGGKIEMAEKWITKTGEDLEDAVFIGDTDHDFETAQALGCKCILYAGGHMSREKLEKFGCPVIGNIREVIELI